MRWLESLDIRTVRLHQERYVSPTRDSGEQVAGREFPDLDWNGREVDGREFEDCSFTKCSFRETVFRSCSFMDCVFAECDLSLMKMPGSKFSGVSFRDCKMMGINWTEACWPQTKLRDPVGFVRCILNHSTFFGLDMTGLRLEGCTAIDVDFREARMARSHFQGTDLSGSSFAATELTEADFSTARNYSIDVRENIVKGAVFSLPEAIALLAGIDVVVTGWEE